PARESAGRGRGRARRARPGCGRDRPREHLTGHASAPDRRPTTAGPNALRPCDGRVVSARPGPERSLHDRSALEPVAETLEVAALADPDEQAGERVVLLAVVAPGALAADVDPRNRDGLGPESPDQRVEVGLQPLVAQHDVDPLD